MRKLLFYIVISVLFTGMMSCEKSLEEYDEPTGEISGKVADRSDKGLPNVFVVFENMQNGALHGTMSKADGSFTFNALATGEYKVFGIQDTLVMGEDTLQIAVKNGQHVVLAENLVMIAADIPQPSVPEVVEVTSSSITLKVTYVTNGSVVKGCGFFYTQDGSEPTIKSNSRTASDFYDTITKDYYLVKMSGLLADKTYRFKSYLVVKNRTPYVSNAMDGYLVLSSEDVEVTTLPIN